MFKKILKYILYFWVISMALSILLYVIFGNKEPAKSNETYTESFDEGVVWLTKEELQLYKKFDAEVMELQKPAKEAFSKVGDLNDRISEGLADKSLTEKEAKQIMSTFKVTAMQCEATSGLVSKTIPDNKLPDHAKTQLLKYREYLVSVWKMRAEGCDKLKPALFVEAKEKYSDACEIFLNFKVKN